MIARKSPRRQNLLRFSLLGATTAKTARRALPEHLPRQMRRHEPKETVCPNARAVTKAGRGCFGDAGVRARQFHGDSACAHEAELHEVRPHCAGRSTEPSDRARSGGAGTAGACAGFEVLRPSAAVSPVGDLRPAGVELERSTLADWVGAAADCWTAGRSVAWLCDGSWQVACR